MSGEDTETFVNRRGVLKAAGTVAALGVGGVGSATARSGNGGNGNGGSNNGNGDDRGGGPPEDPGERTIHWEGQGSEYAEKDCPPDEQACWKWILTPGGQPSLEGVGDLTVTFDDEVEKSVGGEQQGNGAYHFEVCRVGGGTIDSAEVDVGGGGPNSLLTISDVECVPAETLYWQIDFGTGDSPPEPPVYGDSEEELIMAAIGSSDGVLYNPSCNQRRGYIDITTEEGNFDFDDEDDPTEVTIEFEITDGESRDLHLAVFTAPPHDIDEDDLDGNDCPIGETQLDVEDQVYYTHESDEFDEEGSLTIDLPVPNSQ